MAPKHLKKTILKFLSTAFQHPPVLHALGVYLGLSTLNQPQPASSSLSGGSGPSIVPPGKLAETKKLTGSNNGKSENKLLMSTQDMILNGVKNFNNINSVGLLDYSLRVLTTAPGNNPDNIDNPDSPDSPDSPDNNWHLS